MSKIQSWKNPLKLKGKSVNLLEDGYSYHFFLYLPSMSQYDKYCLRDIKHQIIVSVT